MKLIELEKDNVIKYGYFKYEDVIKFLNKRPKYSKRSKIIQKSIVKFRYDSELYVSSIELEKDFSYFNSILYKTFESEYIKYTLKY